MKKQPPKSLIKYQGGWGAAIGAAASLAGTLFGDNKKEVKSNANTNTTTSQSGTQETNNSSRLLSDEDMEAIRSVLPLLQQAGAELTRDMAISDSKSFSDSAVRDLTEKGIPQLFAKQIAAGGYGSTGTALAGNDLVARTSEAIARNQSENILKYAEMQKSSLGALGGLIDALKGGVSSDSSQSKLSQNSQQTGNNTDNKVYSGGMAWGDDIYKLGTELDKLFKDDPNPSTVPSSSGSKLP